MGAEKGLPLKALPRKALCVIRSQKNMPTLIIKVYSVSAFQCHKICFNLVWRLTPVIQALERPVWM